MEEWGSFGLLLRLCHTGYMSVRSVWGSVAWGLDVSHHPAAVLQCQETTAIHLKDSESPPACPPRMNHQHILVSFRRGIHKLLLRTQVENIWSLVVYVSLYCSHLALLLQPEVLVKERLAVFDKVSSASAKAWHYFYVIIFF